MTRKLSEAQMSALAFLRAAGAQGQTVLTLDRSRHHFKTIGSLFERGLASGDSKDFSKCWRFYITDAGEAMLP